MSLGLEQEKSLQRVLVATEAIRAGRMVIMTDDEDRENEGDLVVAAEYVTPEIVNFMAKEARGLICLTLEPRQVAKLNLAMMEGGNGEADRGTAFTVSIEARHGVTTGISAHDRSHTIQTAIKDDVTASDIVVPGHVFPLKARPGGVLQRPGHTEGSVDLARLAGLKPAGVICEIMNDDGTMARLPELEVFAKKFDIPLVTIADLVTFRLLKESMVDMVYHKPVATSHGILDSYVFSDSVDGLQHFALVKGKDFGSEVIDVRVHQQRPLVDVFADSQNGGRVRIERGLEMLQDTQRGILLYLTLKPSAIDLISEVNQMSADKDKGLAKKAELKRAVMDSRQVGVGAQILRWLGVQKMRVHTASTKPLKGISGFGLEVVETCLIKARPKQ